MRHKWARQARGTASGADAHVAGRRHNQQGGNDQRHRARGPERDTIRVAAVRIDHADAIDRAAGCEYERDGQRNGVDSARPGRYRADSRESGSDEIRRQYAGEYVPIGAALEEAQC